MSSELLSFVKEALNKGVTRDRIQSSLLKAGWEQDEIRAALESYMDDALPLSVPRRRPYLSAREAFLYLVLYLSLYISTFSIGTLLFQFINRALPDPIQNRFGYEYQGSLQTIRSATAALIITFPVFLFVSWILIRAMTQHREKRNSKIRKWLTYITLFVAAAIVITDLIILVDNLLSGELTLRFLLKVFTVLVLAGLVFGYYLWDLRSDEQEK